MSNRSRKWIGTTCHSLSSLESQGNVCPLSTEAAWMFSPTPPAVTCSGRAVPFRAVENLSTFTSRWRGRRHGSGERIEHGSHHRLNIPAPDHPT